jgi:hypothetical protein
MRPSSKEFAQNGQERCLSDCGKSEIVPTMNCRRPFFSAPSCTALLLSLATIPAVQAASVSAGNLVIYRVGTGAAALSTAATAVFLDEYTTGGAFVQSIPVASSGGAAMTAVGNATTEGIMTASADGSRLVFAGYRKDAGGSNPSSDTALVTGRVVGMLSLDGTVDTSFAVTDVSGTIRSAVSYSATGPAYIGASSAVRYIADLSPASASAVVDARNSRQVVLSGGILFASNGSTAVTAKVQSYGAAPTAVTVPTAVVTLNSNDAVNGIWFADLNPGIPGDDTVYALSTVANQLVKASFDGTTWTQSGSLSLAGTTGISNLTGIVGPAGVDLYLTTVGTLYSLNDASGYGAAPSGTLNVLATAGANTAFRGIAIMPIPEPSAAVLGLVGLLAMGRRRR